ncbi:CusA/CzcA family heavy metal efflux RND transporter [Maricaulaceae bacterium NA33B04]|nr:CusA/CzcA family heavy metal efflux RND transporter [Maricaulaceae bacterium NA33B04]
MPTTDPELRDPSKGWVASLINWSIQNKLLVLIGAVALLVAGVRAVQSTPLDAVPDMTDTQVIVRTEFPGQSPQLVEDLVTYPMASALLGLPRTEDVRGVSMFGSSFIYVVFEDGVDQYWARSRVLEAISRMQAELPAGAVPELGPDATGVGWVYQYAIVDRSGERDLADLRALQDWFLRYELAAVDGVAEVASAGGFQREYQVLLDPDRLRAFGVDLPEVIEAVRRSSLEASGSIVEQAETEFFVRARGYVTTAADLEQVSLYADDGTPVTIRDMGRVIEGPALRRGVTELNGEGEVVSGIIVMRDGENALEVIDRVKARIAELEPGLPQGVEIVSVYDRAPLIEGAVDYLQHKLIEEAIVVTLVVLIFLLHIRSAFVAIITLPLGVLAAFIVMQAQGVTVNIMSLGGIAIAIGAMVDASIVMVENANRRLSELPAGASRTDQNAARLKAIQEVGPGVFFSLLIITVSFLPVFALTGESFRLFSPLAFTKTYAMAFAAALSVTLVPVLIMLLVRGRLRAEQSNPIMKVLIAGYRPLLKLALRFRWVTLGVTVLLVASSAVPLSRLGGEFMPPLYEGELLYMPTTLPGVSTAEARDILATTNRLIMTVPEVEQAFGKAGRADTATDPAPMSMIETWIRLKPREAWREGLTPEDLIDELNARVSMPGLVNSWGYPIKIRMDMISTGVRTPVGVKVTGDDLGQIERVAADIARVVEGVDGARSAFADRTMGGRYLEINPDRRELARQNVDLASVQAVINAAMGGRPVSESVQGRERYAIAVRYDRPFRNQPSSVGDLLVPSRDGAHIPLSELADIAFVDGPPMIRSENARLTGWVFVDVAGRDLASFVADAQRVVASEVELPAGYAVAWSGQFEQMLEARERLSLAIPAAVLIVFILLMLHFARVDRTLIIMASLPFAMIGGLWSLWIAGYDMSVATAVGFIALGGIAVETAVVMVLYLDQQVREHPPATQSDLFESVVTGAVMRLRPKLMTVLTIFAGLAPVFITDGLGADVMRRIALPMVGGMISTLVLTLFVVPVIYLLWETFRRKLGRDGSHDNTQPDLQTES